MKKLQWKTKHNSKFVNEYNFLDTLLIDCGIAKEDIPGFLKPTKKYVNDPFKMKNMDEAVSLVHKHIQKGSRVFVKVDPDVDGVSSSSALIQFLKQLNPTLEVDYMLNYEKKHGLLYNDVANHTRDEYGLIIIPDASMIVQDARDIKQNFTADIVVLDHHIIENEFYDKQERSWVDRNTAKSIYSEDKNRLEVDCYTNYCVAVNCTDGEYPNPTLCGAGVVQKFIEAYTEKYEASEIIPDCRESFLDLVSLGLIADNMDLRNLESRYYVIQGLKERYWSNEFINELVKKNSEDMKWGRYIVSMGWSIAPKINGCIRYGQDKEQIDMFRAILGEKEEIEYQPRRKSKNDPKPPVEIHSLQETMARVCENIKSRQDTEVRKFVKELEKQIETNGLDKNSVIFVDGTKILEKGTVTGLIANRLASKYFRPVVLMRSKNSLEYGGSMRGYSDGAIENTKEFLESVGITVQGHAQAAGILFKKELLDDIIVKCNQKLPLDQICTVYKVDWELAGSELKREYVQEVAENYAVFGSTVPTPLFAITGIRINASQISGYGDNNSFIRFTYNGIPFVKKYCAHDDFDNMTLKDRRCFGANRKELKLNVIVQFELAAWEDKVTPEAKIIAFDSEEVREAKNGTNSEWEFEEKPKPKKPMNDLDFDW